MLSILIPTYNYPVFALVRELSRQAEENALPCEICVYDDASTRFDGENAEINNLPACRYKKLKNNIGRSAIRNLLANDASYEHLLFLDADTFPMDQNFIATYTPFLTDGTAVVYGGITYQNDPPEQNRILRWKYGKSREALSVVERQKKPYLRFLTLNFLIKKSVFQDVRFNETIPNLRHEDTLFGQDLKKNDIPVKHINNPVLHLGLESNAVFMEKSLASVDVLVHFLKKGFIGPSDVKLTKYAQRLEKSGLKPLFLALYSKTKSMIWHQLLSENPSLFLFDLYRLGHFIELKNEDHA